MIDIESGARGHCLAAVLIASSAQAQNAHGTHASKHGGQFFPASGDTQHIEGVWAQQRIFKVYVYDQLTRPVPVDRLREMKGHIVIGDQEFPLALLADDGRFEARIPTLKLPGEIPLTMTLARDGAPSCCRHS